MIKLATVFSGIGAIEHALSRMGLDKEIIFACDNGDIDVLSKDIDLNMDQINKELSYLKSLIEIAFLLPHPVKVNNKIPHNNTNKNFLFFITFYLSIDKIS